MEGQITQTTHESSPKDAAKPPDPAWEAQERARMQAIPAQAKRAHSDMSNRPPHVAAAACGTNMASAPDGNFSEHQHSPVILHPPIAWRDKDREPRRHTHVNDALNESTPVFVF